MSDSDVEPTETEATVVSAKSPIVTATMMKTFAACVRLPVLFIPLPAPLVELSSAINYGSPFLPLERRLSKSAGSESNTLAAEQKSTLTRPSSAAPG